MAGGNASLPKPTGNTAFFYGTLMAVPILSRVIYGTASPESWQVASLRVRPAILHSYCRYQVRFVDYPGIVPEEGKVVRGTYVEGLTQGDIIRLDRFEGGGYERTKVQVKILSNNCEERDEDIETETYIWTAGRNKLKDEEWDFQEFVKTKLSRWVGSSSEYTEVDEADPLRTHWWQATPPPNNTLGEEPGPKETEGEVSVEETKNAV